MVSQMMSSMTRLICEWKYLEIKCPVECIQEYYIWNDRFQVVLHGSLDSLHVSVFFPLTRYVNVETISETMLQVRSTTYTLDFTSNEYTYDTMCMCEVISRRGMRL